MSPSTTTARVFAATAIAVAAGACCPNLDEDCPDLDVQVLLFPEADFAPGDYELRVLDEVCRFTVEACDDNTCLDSATTDCDDPDTRIELVRGGDGTQSLSVFFVSPGPIETVRVALDLPDGTVVEPTVSLDTFGPFAETPFTCPVTCQIAIGETQITGV